MAKSFWDRIGNAWNTFKGGETNKQVVEYGFRSYRPGNVTLGGGFDRNFLTKILVRIAVDCSETDVRHIKVENGRYSEDVTSPLNDCLTHQANIDQPSKAFWRDVAFTLCSEGAIAIVPVDTSADPGVTDAYDVYTMRVGRVVDWAPASVKVSLYNERKGDLEDIWVPKTVAAVVENPLYLIMNEPNSSLKRLAHKLSMLDVTDDKAMAGKLDVIIQLPYAIRNDLKRSQAEKRRLDIEQQLSNSTHGIAYIDAAEKITQLNRSAENNLPAQIEALKRDLYGEMGLSESVFLGTATELEMLNYHTRTIAPIMGAITQALDRTFISKTARTQGQAIQFFRDPFKVIPLEQLAELGDKFIRNEVFSPNDFRAILGIKPSDDPKANELRNRNVKEQVPPEEAGPATSPEQQVDLSLPGETTTP